MRRPLYPINVWAYQANAGRLISLCESISEALDCAKKLHYTPVVLSTKKICPSLTNLWPRTRLEN